MKKLLLSLAALIAATFAFGQENLLENGGFESWTDDTTPTGWATGVNAVNNAILAKSTVAHGGTYALQITNSTVGKVDKNGKPSTANQRAASQVITLKPGKYSYSAYYRAAEGQAAARLGYAVMVQKEDGTYNSAGSNAYHYNNNQNNWNGPDTISTEWVKSTYDFELTETTTVSFVIMHSKNLVEATVLVDDVTLVMTEEGTVGGGDDIIIDEEAITVAQAQASAKGTQVTVNAQVVALTATGAVLADKTGYIYHFVNAAPTYKLGDNITISGKLGEYGGFRQFSSKDDTNTKVTILSNSAVTYPNPTVMTGADMDEWYKSPEIDYIQFDGNLTISGNYYNVTVQGATTSVGSLVNPTDEMKAKLANGNDYTFTGFAMYTSGGKYINVILTDAKPLGEIVELTDISNTIETAYTPSQCIQLINDEKSDLSKKVYIKGIISAPLKENTPICDTNYGNATFWISEDGTTSAQQFEIYRGFSFGGAKFTAADQLKVGDEVIYLATITKYEKKDKETGAITDIIYETNQGGELVSLNGNTTAIRGIQAQAEEGAIFDLSGRSVAKAQKGIYIIGGKKVLVK